MLERVLFEQENFVIYHLDACLHYWITLVCYQVVTAVVWLNHCMKSFLVKYSISFSNYPSPVEGQLVVKEGLPFYSEDAEKLLSGIWKMIIGPIVLVIWGLWIIFCWREWLFSNSKREDLNEAYKISLLYPLPIVIWICVIVFASVMTDGTD